MLLQVQNNLSLQPSTLLSYLSSNQAAGGTLIPVKNINGFQQNWSIQIGQTGEETAEILTNLGSTGGTALTTSGTVRYAHALDTPVYNIHYDSVIFLRSITGTTGSPSSLATVAITPDSYFTEYNDASGVATYAYQSQYYNSVSGDTSGTSSWFLPGGPTFYSLQKIKSRVKHDLYSSNFIGDIENTLTDWTNEWVELMTNSALKVNKNYSSGTTAYAFGTAGLGTITEPLFKYASKIEITTDGVRYTPSTEIPNNQWGDLDIFSSMFPRHAWTGDTTFQVLPQGNAGTARLTLGKLQNQLINDSDELPQYLKGYTTCCNEYLQYKAYGIDQKDEAANAHYQKFLGYQTAFIDEITPRDQTGIKTIQFTETLSSDDDNMDLMNYAI